jgi:hypothetical protein
MIDITRFEDNAMKNSMRRALALGWVPEGDNEEDFIFQAEGFLIEKLPIEDRVECDYFKQHSNKQYASYDGDNLEHSCEGELFNWRDHQPGDEIDLFTIITQDGKHTQVYYKWKEDVL